MRRRLAFLLVLSSVAAGCSLLVEFDRGKLGSLESLLDATPDGPGGDAAPDAPVADGSGDAPLDAPTDAPADAPLDAPTDAPADVVDGGPDAPVDAPIDAPADAPADVAPDAPADAPPDVVDAAEAGADSGSGFCTQTDFDASEQLSQATVTVTFPSGASPAPYSPRCVKVSAGTVVRFSGSFADHPLQNAGGSANNPIPAVTSVLGDAATSGDLDVTFPDPGTYDYQCQIHFGAGMTGSVQVVP